jgi:hypothetical protein
MATKPNTKLSIGELEGICRANRKFIDRMSGNSPTRNYTHSITTKESFPPFDRPILYKYMSELTWNKFAKNGSFRLSSLQRYRDLEKNGDHAGDRFEGRIFCCFENSHQQYLTSLISGFDTLVFSASLDLENMSTMQSLFGPVIISIDWRIFSRVIQKHLGTCNTDIRKVVYDNDQTYMTELFQFESLSHKTINSCQFIEFMRDESRIPSVFTKPIQFRREKEVRLGFQLQWDVPPTFDIIDQELLSCITRIC